MTSQRVGSAQAVMDGSGANGIIKKQKKCLLLIFSPNLAFNGPILVVLCSKVDFLNLFTPGNVTEKYVLKIVEPFSLHCLARKS